MTQSIVRRAGVPATSADVARAAGVSRGAVSQILNGRGERFASTTRERVVEAARVLNYLPSVAGRTLASGTSDVVVAIVPNATFGTQLQDLFDVLTDELSQAGFTLVLRFSSSSVESLDRLVAGMRPRAVLVLAALSEEERRVLTDRAVPVVEPAGPVRPEDDLNYAIGALQADHLVARGHRRAAYAHQLDSRSDPYGTDRLAAFAARCSDIGLVEPLVIGVPVDRDAALRGLQHLGRGIAIACYNDDVALTLIAAAGQLGWTVPDDVAVVGVDNIPLGQALSPRLTTVAYDTRALAHDMAGAAIRMLRSGDPWQRPTAVDLAVVQGETT